MANTHGIGQYYWHWHTFLSTEAPVYDRVSTHEIEPPYRYGDSRALRIPFTRRGIVWGRWRGSHQDEETALMEAMSGRTYRDAAEVTLRSDWLS
jgi:hypothetical protein